MALDDLANMLIIFFGFLMVILSIVLPRMISKRTLQQTSSLTGAKQHEVRSLERIEDSMVKLEETSREIFGRMDTRARMMVRLIEDAEVRSRQLNELVQRLREARP